MSDERARNFRAWLKRLCGSRFAGMKIALYDPLPKSLKSSIRSWGSALWWPLWRSKQVFDVSSEPNLELSALKRLHIVVGQRCNQHCVMCTSRDDEKVIAPDIYERHLVPIYEHLEEVIIQGGEPTIIKEAADCFDTILAANQRIRFSMMTNGRAFDASWRERFLENGKSVNFSLNAATEATYQVVTPDGDWSQVMSNLKCLLREKKERKSPLKVTCSFVVLNENEEEVEPFKELARELGCDGVRFFSDSRGAKSEAGSLGESLDLSSEAEYCDLPFRALFVHADGRVSFCCHLRDYLGNVRKEPIEKLWNNVVAKSIRLSFRQEGKAYCRNYCAFSESFEL